MAEMLLKTLDDCYRCGFPFFEEDDVALLRLESCSAAMCHYECVSSFEDDIVFTGEIGYTQLGPSGGEEDEIGGPA